ncbi:MAG: response regulator [Sulfurimonas sp.]|jgi:YesN/AraC family two-component response regulator
MDYKDNIEKLKQLLKGLVLLHVEDNANLLEKGGHFFKKLFDEVYQAKNGSEGLELFKKYHPDIIITDIQMPDVDGLEMANDIRKIDKNVKIIITTAYDDKEYLLKTIDIGVVSYLKKPITINALADILYKVAQDIVDEKNKNIFNDYLYHIFNNQENLLFMINDEDVVLVNDYSLDFFGLNNLNEFRDKFKNFGSLLLPHDTFLYEHDDIHYLQELKNNQGKLYNVKMIDKNNNPHHLLLKLSSIEGKKDFYILSLNDITELNLLGLFDKKSLDHDKAFEDESSVLNLLIAAKESQAEIKIHNYYEGLSVTHGATVIAVSKEKVVLKTVYLQQKAIAFEKRVILTSELFPFDIESDDIKVIDFQHQSVEIAHCKMIKSTPTMRQHVTLTPDPNNKITLFYNEHKFDTEMHIINLSINSIKLSLNFLPAGLKVKDLVTINMVLNEDKKPIIVHVDAMVFRVIELKKNYELVLIFNTDAGINKILVDYIAKRQMKLIREFKELQYEK